MELSIRVLLRGLSRTGERGKMGGLGKLCVLVLALSALALAAQQYAVPVELLGSQDKEGAAVTKGGFWDDESDLWKGSQQQPYVVFERKGGAGAAPQRRVAKADEQHAAEAATQKTQNMRSDIDELSMVASDLIKATQNTAATKNALRSGLMSPSPRHPILEKKTNRYKGVNLDKVYNKAFDAAFKAAYGGAYQSVLGKAEEKLWKKVNF